MSTCTYAEMLQIPRNKEKEEVRRTKEYTKTKNKIEFPKAPGLGNMRSLGLCDNCILLKQRILEENLIEMKTQMLELNNISSFAEVKMIVDNMLKCPFLMYRPRSDFVANNRNIEALGIAKD